MWNYEKRLEFPISIKTPNAKMAKYIISQYGGPDGELAASLRYLTQKFAMPDAQVKGLLNDIGTEESAPCSVQREPGREPESEAGWVLPAAALLPGIFDAGEQSEEKGAAKVGRQFFIERPKPDEVVGFRRGGRRESGQRILKDPSALAVGGKIVDARFRELWQSGNLTGEGAAAAGIGILAGEAEVKIGIAKGGGIQDAPLHQVVGTAHRRTARRPAQEGIPAGALGFSGHGPAADGA